MAGHIDRARYRVAQFVRGITARVTDADRALLEQTLTQEQRALFARMPVDGQKHSLNVLHTLRIAGHHNPELHVAALLHDVGKAAAEEAGVPITVWTRGPLVLTKALLGPRASALESADPADGWRYLLHVHSEHARIGAAWAAEAGCSALTCWLIAQHDAPTDANMDANMPPKRASLLAALQWADDLN